jgi:Mrp family chromosome partitioning ATPase/capsular polysaccharide biosynthesis protein
MTARALFAAVWRRRWLALIVFVVEIGIVVAWLAVAPRKYTATATISATPSADLLSSTGNFDALEQTVAQIANSRSVLADVHERTDGIRPIWKLREEVSGTLVDNTVLVRVSVVDKSPEVAARVANAVATVLPLHDPSGGMFVFTQTDPASVPQSYSSPNTKLIALVGAVLGVFLAVAAALIRDRTARTIETPGQLRAYAGTDVLASVPRPRDPWDLTRIDAEEPIAGALRSLRVELDYASSDRPTGAIVIADANASAGDEQAPWLAVSLATSLAQVNHRVLVIDGDFRAPNRPPQLSRNGRPGLVGVLRRSNAVDDAIHVDLVPGVDVLPAGDANPPGVANLIELEFQRLLGELSGRYDAVLVIAPPASASGDARVMAIGGSLLLVVAARTVRESRLREIIADLRATRTRVLGAVLIAMRQRANA